MADAARRERRDHFAADRVRRAALAPASALDPAAHGGVSPWDAPNAPMIGSPALRLQQRLAEEITEDRWPWSLTAAFVLGTCSAFWITLYALLRLLIG